MGHKLSVEQLQSEILSQRAKVSDLLLRAKVVATQYEHDDFLRWINRELRGYGGLPINDLPRYRIVHGRLMALDQRQRLIPTLITNQEIEDTVSTYHVHTGIETIESAVSDISAPVIDIVLSPEMKAILRKVFDENIVEFVLQIPRSVFMSVIGEVRTELLDWCIRLQQLGISSDRLGLEESSRQQDHAMMQNCFISGNVTIANHTGRGIQIVENSQRASTGTIGIDALRDALPSLRQGIAVLPEELRPAATATLNQVATELSAPSPERGKLRRLLDALRGVAKAAGASVLEGAVGALVEKALGNAAC